MSEYRATEDGSIAGLTTPGEGDKPVAGASPSGVAGPAGIQVEVLVVTGRPGAAPPAPTALEVDGVAAETTFAAREPNVGGGWRLDPPVVAPPGSRLTARLDGEAWVVTCVGHQLEVAAS